MSNPLSFKIFLASSIVIPSILGTSTIFSDSAASFFLASIYGKISENNWPPIGAATPPPWCPPSPVGLYKVTNKTICGSSIGATPTNEVTYLFVFTPSSDVPVFPPMLYPLTCAFFPVPTSTTVFIILNTLFAVSLDITFSSFSIGISILSPVLLFTFALTILGFTCVPPFE